ncbi:gene transfer agent family protein [Salipiger manganoxidans]|uniref:gene transfer agent family protein n=1 Tax=Salipiger marinus TaxID=555512 RepID=UPI001E6332FA|nr:gene transfer agent family protein [Salipiger manganoxidans]MCD1620739.1 gene transfer agent family protein [Salipiger manganoxidans]
MSCEATITLDWADGTYPFALDVPQLRELQEKCDAGPWFIQWALEATSMARSMGLTPPRDMSTAYVSETIRLGLIGGGMPAIVALKKVRDYVGAGQFVENIPVAHAVISVALQGVPEDEPEKQPGGSEISENRSPEARSDSRSSTEQAPQSA